MDVVVELEEHHQIGLRGLLAERLAADHCLILATETQLDGRFECALESTFGVRNRNKCGATADKAIVAIERPMLVDTGVNTQTCVPFGTVVNAIRIDFDLRIAGLIEIAVFVQILMAEGLPEIVVPPKVDIDNVLVVVGERSPNLTATIIGVEVRESAR